MSDKFNPFSKLPISKEEIYSWMDWIDEAKDCDGSFATSQISSLFRVSITPDDEKIEVHFSIKCKVETVFNNYKLNTGDYLLDECLNLILDFNNTFGKPFTRVGSFDSRMNNEDVIYLIFKNENNTLQMKQYFTDLMMKLELERINTWLPHFFPKLTSLIKIRFEDSKFKIKASMHYTLLNGTKSLLHLDLINSLLI